VQPTLTPTVPQTGTIRNARIDLLRGMAILLVVIHHLALRIPPEQSLMASVLPRRVIDGLCYHGYEMVFIFFVISGFLITTNALTRWENLNRIELRSFYARRFARIAPCLLILVAVLSVLDLLGAKYYLITHVGQSLPAAISAALGFYLNWYEGHTGYLPGGWDVLWSLSIEEVFYIAFPILCLLLRREWILAPVLVVLALSLPWTHAALADNEIWQEKAYLPGMAAIATGVLAALVAARLFPAHRRWNTLLTTVGVLGIGAVVFADDLLWRTIHDAALLLLTLSAACLVVAFHWKQRALPGTPVAGTAWLCVFGRLSYEIYLTHMFVVFGTVEFFHAAGENLTFGMLWYPPAVALSWALASVVDKTISTPCNRSWRARLMRTGNRPVIPTLTQLGAHPEG
jgi:peptidoglycan/LPS O-acetylase OafA/YrhL